MKYLTVAATKAEEIAHYNAFLATLQPGTYLHSMFAKTGGRVENEIRNDIAIGPVDDAIAERERVRKELAELQKAKVKEAKDTLYTIRDVINTAKGKMRRMIDI